MRRFKIKYESPSLKGMEGRMKNILLFLCCLYIIIQNFHNNVTNYYGSGFGNLSSSKRLATTSETTTTNKRITDGCYHLFLDVGANIGVHTRFLFEPLKYPQATKATNIFGKQFGFISNDQWDNRDFCAVGFEPNPTHYERHQSLKKAYDAMGWRYIPLHAGVSDHNGNMTFYKNDFGDNEDWGFSTHRLKPDAAAVVVPVMRLARFLLDDVQHRTMPQHVYGNYSLGPRVVMKMDIESQEYFVLPDIIASGAMCGTIDYCFGEFHPWDITLRSNISVTGRGGALAGRQFIFTMRNAMNCKSVFQELDDESYLHDGMPFPEPPSSPPDGGV